MNCTKVNNVRVAMLEFVHIITFSKIKLACKLSWYVLYSYSHEPLYSLLMKGALLNLLSHKDLNLN